MENISSTALFPEEYTTVISDFTPFNIGTVPPLFAKVGVALMIALGIIGNGIIIKVYLTSK